MDVSSGDDRRRFARVRYRQPCTIAADGTSHLATCVDINLRGARLLLSNTVDIAGREVDLALGGSDAEFTFSATTVWQDGAEAGIQFTEIPFDSFVHARNVVLQNTDEVEADLQQVRETCP